MPVDFSGPGLELSSFLPGALFNLSIIRQGVKVSPATRVIYSPLAADATFTFVNKSGAKKKRKGMITPETSKPFKINRTMVLRNLRYIHWDRCLFCICRTVCDTKTNPHLLPCLPALQTEQKAERFLCKIDNFQSIIWGWWWWNIVKEQWVLDSVQVTCFKSLINSPQIYLVSV